MKKGSLLLLIVCCVACSSQKEKEEVPLFNNLTFVLAENEKTVTIDKRVEDAYFGLLKEKEIQPPLFRYISSADYSIYIGIPYNIQLSQFANAPIVEGDTATCHSDTDFMTYCYNRFNQDSVYVSEYVVQQKGNLIYVLAATKTSSISDSLFSKKNLSNRIKVQDENKKQ